MGYYAWPIHWDFDEEKDLKRHRVWILDKKDCVPAFKPLALWSGTTIAASPATQYACETLSIPTSKGLEFRTIDCFNYATCVEVDEEEAKQREPVFREKMTPWIDDYEREWGKIRDEVVGYYERLKKTDVAKASDVQLRDHFEDWLWVLRRSWYLHFVPMDAVYAIYVLLEDLCRDLLGIDGTNTTFKALLMGFDNRIFQTDRGLWRLADRARELGLEPTFNGIKDDDELLSKLGENDSGRKWLQEFHQFLETDGWRSPRVFGLADPYWLEKPSTALPNIRQVMAKGGAFVLDAERERLTREREEAEKEVISRVPAGSREMFEKLLRGAQWAGRFSEEHGFYFEGYVNALGRRVCMEVGRRFTSAGIIDEPEDIFFLLPDEIVQQAIPRKNELQKVIKIRKDQYEDWSKIDPLERHPMFLGNPEVLGEVLSKDLILRFPIACMPIVKPELKADIYGGAAAPGVAEGTARVIMSEAEFDQVQPGEILVTPNTSPVWTPLFGIVKAVITDAGGALAHCVIVGREYGIPVVAATMDGSMKIKTGQKLRVDGDNCCVYFLE